MASKLFRAVVGFGIGLGTASAACFGATDDAGTTTEKADASASTPTITPPSSRDSAVDPAIDASSDVNVGADASLDAPADTGLDAPKDVGVDAFCDAAWPTTKGNPKPPTCIDPNGHCADAGRPEHCYAPADAGGCDFSTSTAPFCVSGDWQCSSGTTTFDKCN